MSSESDSAVDQTLDVREIDGEPFEEILSALNQLEADETLRLINNFEPEPLYNVLEQRGYSYESTHIDSNEWHVHIHRS